MFLIKIVFFLLFSGITSDVVLYDKLLYKIKNKLNYRLVSQENSNIQFTIEGYFYFEKNNKFKPYSYNSGFYNVTVIKSNGYKEIQNLDTCQSFRKVIEALKTPFLAVYDNSHKFKGVKFSTKDINLSINLKYTYASSIQVDVSKLTRNDKFEYTIDTNETMLLGCCDTKYDVIIKETSQDLAKYFLNKKRISCMKNKSDITINYTSSDFCNSQSKKNFKVYTTNDVEVFANKNFYVLTNLTETDVRIFNPWKQSSEEIQLSFRTNAYFLKFLENVSFPEFDESSSKLAINSLFSQPNESFIYGSAANKAPDLKKIYMALICDASIETTSRELIEEAIKCEIEQN